MLSCICFDTNSIPSLSLFLYLFLSDMFYWRSLVCYFCRVGQTGATGVTFKESIQINKSLFVLRKVSKLNKETPARHLDLPVHSLPNGMSAEGCGAV